MKCKSCGHEIKKMNTIKIKELKIEVEINIHDKNKKLSDIEIPKGWRLLKVNEIIFLKNNYEKKLNLEDTWEFIEQPFKQDYVARFCASAGRAGLGCDGYPDGTYSSLGVRFCKDIGGKLI